SAGERRVYRCRSRSNPVRDNCCYYPDPLAGPGYPKDANRAVVENNLTGGDRRSGFDDPESTRVFRKHRLQGECQQPGVSAAQICRPTIANRQQARDKSRVRRPSITSSLVRVDALGLAPRIEMDDERLIELLQRVAPRAFIGGQTLEHRRVGNRIEAEL